MKESTSAADLIVAAIPEDVMHAFEVDDARSTLLVGPNRQTSLDTAPLAPWRNRLLCPQGLAVKYPRPHLHLLAVAGILIAGVVVIYMTALRMGIYVSSEEAALLLTTLSYSNDTAPPPLSADDSQSTLDYNITNPEESSQVANISAPVPSFEEEEKAPTSPPSSPPQSLRPSSPTSPPPRPRIFYQNMSETWHTMSDKALLLKASSYPREAHHPNQVAYMFMTRGPLPFAPLWERYFRGHAHLYNIYIHAHPVYVPDFAPTSPFFSRFIPSKLVQWGKLSMYRAERRLLGNALLDGGNQWFLLLSELCVPIFSFPDTFNYLEKAPGMSFIEAYTGSNHTTMGRLQRGLYKEMAPEVTARNFRKGSQWFQITRDLAHLAAADSPEYAKFEKYFCAVHPVCYIDEHFLPTLAWIRRPREIAFRTLTYYEFRGKSAHPRKFGAEDVTEDLLNGFRAGKTCMYNGQTTSRCYLFVRKFDPSALDALLRLAEPVVGIDP